MKEFASSSLQYFTGLTLAFHTEKETIDIVHKAIDDAQDQRKKILEHGMHIDTSVLRERSPKDA